ncbi:MAG: PEP/pyruvate-binding domain-containing protein [Candidatus Paceibacteria bacterium]
MPNIKGFNELDSNSTDQAGGKGASLGEMTNADIPVPPGFVVLSEAFDEFLNANSLHSEIDAKLHQADKDDTNSIEQASEAIQGLIKNKNFPEKLKQQVEERFEQLNCEYVAVRSSATEEDSDESAWAGQLNTFLNTNKETLCENIKKCWASLFTPRAIFYRFENDLHGKDISVAVVVQKMIDSDVSGVAFSVHPVTEDENQVIIEACYGLGEAVVSGQITPDSYVVEKDPRNILDVNISTQKKALYKKEEISPNTTEPNEWQNLSEQKGGQQVLTEQQVNELTEIILDIESHYGFPCDIEWCMEEGDFFIVQSRPITTLSD